MAAALLNLFRILIACLLFVGLMPQTAFSQIVDIEDFGSGPYPGAPLPAGQTSYNYNAPPQPAVFPDILEDGDYVLATNSQQGFENWASIGDNTTGTGYMMLVNADDNQSGEFYRRQVSLTPNENYEFSAFLVNVNSQSDFDFCTANEGGLSLPNVTLQIENSSGVVLSSFDTGDIPFDPTPAWEEYSLLFSTDASTTSVNVVLVNNSLGGCGNDLALDDITFRVAITVEALDDSVTVRNTDTPQNAVINLGDNDTRDGNPLTGSELFYVAPESTLPTGISLNTNTGDIDVAQGTSEGTYSFVYQLCETSNQNNCDTATATIIIDFTPLPISSINDNGSVSDTSTGFTAVLNVLDNDSIDGVSPPNEFELSVSSGSSLPADLTFDLSTGEVGVIQNTPSGTYSFDYDLCVLGNPTNCDTATVTITVSNPSGGVTCPASQIATTDTYHVVSATGGVSPERTVGAPLAEGATATDENAAFTFFETITMDLTGSNDILVPEGELIELALTKRFSDDARAEILMSADGVSYTSLGTTGTNGSVYGEWTANIIRYDDFIVPAGGARYVQIDFQIGGGVRADGAIYGTQCQDAPNITASKSVSVYNPDELPIYATPGNDVIYTIAVENTGLGSTGQDSLFLVDNLPSEIAFYNDDLNGTNGPEVDPVIFTDNGSGLTFNYSSDVAFSDNVAAPTNFSQCDYTPLPSGYDDNIAHICINPKGQMLANSNWSISFRAQIK